MGEKFRKGRMALGGVFVGIVIAVAAQMFFLDSRQQASPPQEPVAEARQSASVLPEWREDKAYNGGDRVMFKGQTYEARWWTQGEVPDADKQDYVWKKMKETTESGQAEAWSAGKAYVAGDKVIFENKAYEAKWWTQGEKPNAQKADAVWRLIEGVTVGGGKHQGLAGAANAQGFKIVGYYPDWQPELTDRIRYDIVTHIIYAFAIPREDGTLLPLENPAAAEKILTSAHASGSKVLLAVGGWSYRDTPLENTFAAATATREKREALAENCIAMAQRYGFDGIDIDWEYPRTDGSAAQYAEFMAYLRQRAKQENLLLTIAVMAGKTPEGTVQYDAAAQTDAVLANVDWINIMAYDGGDGERHSGYAFAIDCARYWKEVRAVPAHKVVLGVPFYGRPSWLAYREIIAADPGAAAKDIANINGTAVHYNGIETLQNKTKWAREQIGGIMIWELSQDSAAPDQSLQQAIGRVVGK